MKKPILVTGAHRSGSTWVGKIIGSASNVRYVHEPFNIEIARNNSPIYLWFQYFNSKTELAVQNRVKAYLLSFCSPFKVVWSRVHNGRNIAKRAHLYLAEFNSRKKCRTLLKDPLAFMSTEWIYHTIDCDVIVVVRHPAAFIASLKRKGWTVDFTHFTKQPELMTRIQSGFVKKIHHYANVDHSLVDQGILLWNIIYSTAIKYQQKYAGSWYFVKHEALSQKPIKEFEKIFGFLHLEFNLHVKEQILKSTQANNPTELHRNSLKNVMTWKSDLSEDEILKVKQKTKAVWEKYYSEQDW